METNSSLFSCLRQSDSAEARIPPPPPPLPVKPPVPDQSGKLAQFESRLNKLEAGLASSMPENRIKGLEESVLELKQRSSGQYEARFREISEVLLAVKAIKTEMSAQAARLAAVEAASATPAADPRPGAGTGALEQRQNALERRVTEELGRRLDALETSLPETFHKAIVACEASGGNTRRLEKLEERIARVSYMENRLASIERKFERLCETEAVVEALKVGFEGLENTVRDVIHSSAVSSGEQKKTASELESVSRQTAQLSALFNYFRGELGFLLPKKRESSGG